MRNSNPCRLFADLFGMLTTWIVCCMIAACSADKPELGDISGTVKDDEGHAIANALVSLSPSGKSIHTNTQGKYFLEDLSPVTYTVIASASGYVTEKKEAVQVVIGETALCDFVLHADMPLLTLDKDVINFGTEHNSASLTITNAGYAELEWGIKDLPDWLSCSDTPRRLKPKESQTIILVAIRSALEENTYTKKITITSTYGGTKYVDVEITILGLGLTWSPEVLDFGGFDNVKSLAFSSKANIDYTLTPSDNWILVGDADKAGTIYKSKEIKVSVSREGLSPGTYDGCLTLEAESKRKDIPVKMIVQQKSKPKVQMVQVKDVTDQSATFEGSVLSVGSSKVTHYGFRWSRRKNATEWETALENDFLGLGEPRDKVQFMAQDLSSNSHYKVCMYATNAEGTSYSSELEFDTNDDSPMPRLTVGPLVELKAKSACIYGEILSLGTRGEITAHGHVWGTHNNPIVSVSNPVDKYTSKGKATSVRKFESELTGLSPATTYYVRTYATNGDGTVYSDNFEFTTPPDAMMLTTIEAADCSHDRATLGGMITYDGGNVVTERGVCIGTSSNPTVDGTHYVSSDHASLFHVDATNLQPSTTYHVRAYAKAETGMVYYGNDITFTTTVEIFIPSLSLPTVDGITFRSATFHSVVGAQHNGNIRDAGFVVATHSEPTLSDMKVVAGANSGNISAKTSSLQPSTTYYVRAYATNERGTGYSQAVEFSTTAKPEGSDIDADDYDGENNWNAYVVPIRKAKGGIQTK